ncbi:hypothetical protein ACHWQZ_G015496 [Mnemiopsis leidyi]
MKNYSRHTGRLLSTAKDKVGVDLTCIHNDKTVVLTLRNEGKMNCMTEFMAQSFKGILQNLTESHPRARCLVITGHGKSFAAGADLAWLQERSITDPSKNIQIMREYYGFFTPLLEIPIPTIAAINGPAIGAGFCVSMFCDLRITADDAKLGANFVKVGISPGMGGSFTLPQKLTNQVCNDITLTGRTFSGKEAEKMGVVLKSVSSRSMVLEESLQLAEQIVNTTSPNAMRETVKLLRAPYLQIMDSQLQLEAEAQSRCFASDDFKIALASVKNKTVPVFD